MFSCNEKWIKVTSFAAAANLFLFMIGSGMIGGGATNERTGNGRYFVRDHEKFREVSLEVFIYSIVHSIITVLLLLFAILMVNHCKKRKTMALDEPNTTRSK